MKHGYVITEKLNKMDRLEIDNILKIDKLNSELEFERATLIQGKLRWMVEDDSSLESVRKHLLVLIENYESEHWSNESKISEEQVKESDIAEKIVSAESVFIQKRKDCKTCLNID